MPLIIQAAQVVPLDMADLILRGAGLLVTGAVAYGGNELRKIGKEVSDLRTELAAWRVVLFGINNDNGLNGDVRRLKRVVFEEGDG